MKKLTFLFYLLSVLSSFTIVAQVPVRPAHVIIVMEENYAYSEIIGSSLAPTLTALSGASYTANFTQDYAITHPSEPNYLCLFSGSQQGVTGDISGQDGAPFTDCNLGASLIQNGYTFIGYSESQPSIGWYSADDPPYYTKHSPWINWINAGNDDSIPVLSDLPYTSFPDSNNYASLPTVSWVIPDIDDDMHDPPSDPTVAIPNGDNWFHANIMPLVRWASIEANNTVVITTWDEDDGTMGNNIALLVSSGLVNGGNYSTTLNHYDVLRTIEDMYNIPECGSSDSTASAIDMPVAIWKTSTGINTTPAISNRVTIGPVPAKDELTVTITSLVKSNTTLGIYDITGRLVKEESTELVSGENIKVINTTDISNGFYFLTVKGTEINTCNKIVVEK